MVTIIIPMDQQDCLHIDICKGQIQASFQGGGRALRGIWPNKSTFNSQKKKDSAGVSILQYMGSEIIS